MPIGWAITIVVLCVAVVGLAIIVLGVLRQVAPLLERATAPVPALHSHGPAVGSPLPHFAVRGADGEVTDEHLHGRPALLLFLSVGCDPCKSLAEEMSHADLDDRLAGALVIVTGPDGPEELGIPAGVRVLTEQDQEVSGPLSVTGTPFAIAADADGIVKAAVVPDTVDRLAELAADLA